MWASLSDEQKGWVQAAADEVGAKEPAQAIALDHESRAKLEKMGVKFVTDVDKSGSSRSPNRCRTRSPRPRPAREKILQICRSIQ